jgi:hypothetical protein
VTQQRASVRGQRAIRNGAPRRILEYLQRLILQMFELGKQHGRSTDFGQCWIELLAGLFSDGFETADDELRIHLDHCVLQPLCWMDSEVGSESVSLT